MRAWKWVVAVGVLACVVALVWHRAERARPPDSVRAPTPVPPIPATPPASVAEALVALRGQDHEARAGAAFFARVVEIEQATIREIMRTAFEQRRKRPWLGTVLGRTGTGVWDLLRDELGRAPEQEARESVLGVIGEIWPKPLEPPEWLVAHHFKAPTLASMACLSQFGTAGKRAALRNGLAEYAWALFPMDDVEYEEFLPIIREEFRLESSSASLALDALNAAGEPYDTDLAADIYMRVIFNLVRLDDWFDPEEVSESLEKLNPEVSVRLAAKLPVLLQHESPSVRYAAAELAQTMGPSAALAQALFWEDEPDTDTRARRIESIADMGEHAHFAIPQLWRDTESTEEGVKHAALLSLARIDADSERIVLHVVSMLDAGDAYGLDVLAELGPSGRGALPALERMALRGSEMNFDYAASVREFVEGTPSALTLIRWFDKSGDWECLQALELLSSRKQGATVIPELLERLNAPRGRLATIYTLLALGDRSSETLAAARTELESRVPFGLAPRTQTSLLKAVAEDLTPQNVLVLERLLRHEHARLRTKVLRVLVGKDEIPHELGPSLASCLSSTESRIRRRALRAIAVMGWVPKSGIDVIRACVATEPAAAVAALGAIGDGASLPWIKHVFRTGSNHDRRTAAESLWMIQNTWDAYRVLLADVDPKVRVDTVQWLLGLHGAEALEIALPLVTDPVPGVRVATLEALSGLKPRPAAVTHALKRARKDRHAWVRAKSAEWLADD